MRAVTSIFALDELTSTSTGEMPKVTICGGSVSEIGVGVGVGVGVTPELQAGRKP